MVTRPRILAGSIVTGSGRLVGEQPISAVYLQDGRPTLLMGDAAALRSRLRAQPADRDRARQRTWGSIRAASARLRLCMKALKAEVGV